jgi:phosphoserine phosphatase RsbU/P
MTEALGGCLLIIDDNEFDRLVLGHYVEILGHTVTYAENGRQALDKLQEKMFEMILLDIDMPEMNGYQVLDFILINKKLQNIPVIVTSAIEGIDSIVKCIEMGAEDYLIKPVNQVLLKARIGACLEKKRLRDQQSQTLTRLEHEMEIARQTQIGILPEFFPKQNGYDFGALMKPAAFVGGDFYDFFPLGDAKLGVVIGDVCGKGLPAALFMSLTYGLIRAEANHTNYPTETLLKVNRHLLRMNTTNIFVTLIYGILDYDTGSFNYARAGHQTPVIFSSQNPSSFIRDQPGQPLGILEEPILDEQSIIIPEGGMTILYSDGLCEAPNKEGREFGLDGLRQVCLSHRSDNAIGTCQRLWDAVRTHVDDSLPQDDFTVLVIKRIIH